MEERKERKPKKLEREHGRTECLGSLGDYFEVWKAHVQIIVCSLGSVRLSPILPYSKNSRLRETNVPRALQQYIYIQRIKHCIATSIFVRSKYSLQKSVLTPLSSACSGQIVMQTEEDICVPVIFYGWPEVSWILLIQQPRFYFFPTLRASLCFGNCIIIIIIGIQTMLLVREKWDIHRLFIVYRK